MRALVVYESMFGSTRTVALEVGRGLATALETTVLEVSQAPSTVADDLDLLVVAAPTHAGGLSRPRTRRAARRLTGGPLVSEDLGLREWLAGLTVGDVARQHCCAVAVDTRLAHGRPPGSAARRAQTRLWRKGVRLSAAPETFWVGPGPGELLAGEADRARAWGERLATKLVHDLHQRSWEHQPQG